VKKRDLHIKFGEAFEAIGETDIPIPQDVLLQLYALYKQASFDHTYPTQLGKEHHLVSAFKANALFQVKNLSPEEAKEAYIELVTKILKDGKA